MDEPGQAVAGGRPDFTNLLDGRRRPAGSWPPRRRYVPTRMSTRSFSVLPALGDASSLRSSVPPATAGPFLPCFPAAGRAEGAARVFHVMESGCGGVVHHDVLAPTSCQAQPTVAGLWQSAHGRSVWLGFACDRHADELVAPRRLLRRRRADRRSRIHRSCRRGVRQRPGRGSRHQAWGCSWWFIGSSMVGGIRLTTRPPMGRRSVRRCVLAAAGTSSTATVRQPSMRE